jgi:hypothetical protein
MPFGFLRHMERNRNIPDIIAVILIWLVALALVYLVVIKIHL